MHVKIIVEGILNICLLQAMKTLLVVKDNLIFQCTFLFAFGFYFLQLQKLVQVVTIGLGIVYFMNFMTEKECK